MRSRTTNQAKCVLELKGTEFVTVLNRSGKCHTAERYSGAGAVNAAPATVDGVSCSCVGPREDKHSFATRTVALGSTMFSNRSAASPYLLSRDYAGSVYQLLRLQK